MSVPLSFDQKTETYLKWSQEQERWINEFSDRIHEAVERECKFIEIFLKTSREVKAKIQAKYDEFGIDPNRPRYREDEVMIEQELLKDFEPKTRFMMQNCSHLIENREDRVYFACCVLPDFMIPVDAMGEFHWFASGNSRLLSNMLTPENPLKMECEIAMGTETYDFFVKGYQRFCNEVRRRTMELVAEKFRATEGQWSFGPRFSLTNYDTRPSVEVVSGHQESSPIGFHCAITIMITKVPPELEEERRPRGELRQRVHPRRIPDEFEQYF